MTRKKTQVTTQMALYLLIDSGHHLYGKIVTSRELEREFLQCFVSLVWEFYSHNLFCSSWKLFF